MQRFAFTTAIKAAAIFFCTLIAFDAAQTQPASIEGKLPKSWVGEFRWNNDRVTQRYEIALSEIKRLAGDQFEAIGCGRVSVPKQVTDIRVRMAVNARSLGVEIWESDPNQSNFVTDGSHRGRLLDDLQRIEAEWVTQSTGKRDKQRTGQRGKMRLVAAGNLACPLLSAAR